MTSRYSPEQVRRFYDEYGEAEWGRFDRNIAGRVGLEMHTRFLGHWVRPGDRVLEVGAGPGRFTIELARLGARISVGDISPRQLELNRERVKAAGAESAVEVRELLDVVDLSRYAGSGFDVSTAYGGPLSYVFDRAGTALDQLLAVVRPGGRVLFSVMSRWGSIHQFLAGLVYDIERGLGDEVDKLSQTGDQLGELARSAATDLPHEMHLFTWAEIQTLLRDRPCHLLDAASANFLSVRADSLLEGISQEAWMRFLDLEERACRATGSLDSGTHIIVAIEKRTP